MLLNSRIFQYRLRPLHSMWTLLNPEASSGSHQVLMLEALLIFVQTQAISIAPKSVIGRGLTPVWTQTARRILPFVIMIIKWNTNTNMTHLL